MTRAEPIACELLCQADEPHLQQIYAGFGMLARAGRIRLRQRLLPVDFHQPDLPAHLVDVRASHLVALAGGLRIGYDVHDASEVNVELLERVDVYFKRSWEEEQVAACAAPDRVLPLGANVWVHDAAPSLAAWQRSRLLHGPERLKAGLRALGLDRLLGDRLFTPRLTDIEAPPPFDLPPRVLFLAEAWDPDTAPSPETAAERVAINALRAGCMRALREEFGALATCGFRATPFALRAHADLVVNDARLTRKRNYLALVREHAICIASSGLHRSIGWKFAEYLAMSRAIVSERLHMRLPGAFTAGTHYLEFADAASCVAAVRRLIDDAGARARMMQANLDYYRAHGRPDAMVAASLQTALARSEPV
jgi:hypothetical protein